MHRENLKGFFSDPTANYNNAAPAPAPRSAAVPVFCLACETKFPDRVSLEEHPCPAASYICSCGIGFPDYVGVLEHSVGHDSNGSGFMVNHVSAIQHRMHTIKEQEMKLMRLEGNWKASRSVAPLLANVPHGYTRGPTKSLCRKFSPVVRLETLREFDGKRRHMCARCQVLFFEQDRLVEHVSLHSRMRVHGCQRCGTLLLSNAFPPSFHRCGSFRASPAARFTVGKVLYDSLSAQKTTVFPCLCCSLKFDHEVHLNNHVRMNHTNKDVEEGASKKKAKECSQKKASVTSENKVQRNLVGKSQQTLGKNAQGSLEEKSLRCALCKVNFDTVKTLGQHWCSRKLILFKTESPKQPDVDSGVPDRPSPCAPTGKNSDEEVTFRFQASRNMKTYQAKLKSVKTEPVPVSPGVATQTDLLKPVSVKIEVESDDESYVTESASTKKNPLFYQSLTPVFPVLKT